MKERDHDLKKQKHISLKWITGKNRSIRPSFGIGRLVQMPRQHWNVAWSERRLRRFGKLSFPIASMYGIFAYIYHKNKPNVGNYYIYIYHTWMVWVWEGTTVCYSFATLIFRWLLLIVFEPIWGLIFHYHGSLPGFFQRCFLKWLERWTLNYPSTWPKPVMDQRW